MWVYRRPLRPKPRPRPRLTPTLITRAGVVVSATAIGHATPNSALVAFAAQYIYPDADRLDDGWDTQPTPGQDLFDQLDEDPASDTDFIVKV